MPTRTIIKLICSYCRATFTGRAAIELRMKCDRCGNPIYRISESEPKAR